MKTLITALTIVATLAFAGLCEAGTAWSDADAASPLLVRYMDADNAGTIQVAATAITVIDDGNTTTITLTETYTLAEVIAAIGSATNTSGEKNFEAVYWAGLAADTVSNSLVTAAATTITKTWNRVVLWDTSNCLHYDVVANPGMGRDRPAGGVGIGSIYGDFTGTGDVTLSVYVNRSRQFLKVITSPVYVPNTLYTNIVADPVVNDMIHLEQPLVIGADQVGFVRAARATTATTGGIGCGIE